MKTDISRPDPIFPPHLTKRRSLDNYLTDAAVKVIKGPNYSALKEFEKLEDVNPYGWSKAENWRIAREMAWEEIANTDVGAFLTRTGLLQSS